MGKPTGFMEIARQTSTELPPEERIQNFNEFHIPLPQDEQQAQGARCMDCGVPFCQAGMMIGGMASGCPLNNLIPEWNDLVYQGKWDLAVHRLRATNRFPEFTSRVCPALCEAACTCGYTTGSPVTVKENEHAIVEYGYESGLLTACPPPTRTGKTVAVVGAGPAGLAVADYLNKRGHKVTVYEREDRVGGLLMYGIPNMKLEKQVIDRRVNIMKAEGIDFVTCADVGGSTPAQDVLDAHDAVVLACGAKQARDINAPGRDAQGIYFAVDYLTSVTRSLLDSGFSDGKAVSAKDKKVLVIGGGDTGSDCIGTSIRQGAVSVTQIEIMPQPPIGHNPDTPWPQWPVVLKTTSSHEEGCTRRWSLASTRFIGKNGKVCGVEVEEVEWLPATDGNRPTMKSTGKKEVIEADMVLLAMGFLKPEQPKFAENVFVAGDAAHGASLVVRALADGRRVATEIARYLAPLKENKK